MWDRYLPDVVTLTFDPARCNGCKRCVEVCPRAVFAMEERRAALTDRDACIECGACALNCVPQAIRVNAGVGCAAAYIQGSLKGGEASCGCGGEEKGGACCG